MPGAGIDTALKRLGKTPQSNVAKLAAEVKRVEGAMPPPPPPPPPSKPKVERWRHPMTEAWDRQFHEFSKRSGALPPPADGYMRLYRAGAIPGAEGPRSADDVIQGPFGKMTRGELDAMKGGGHSNPLGAEGRWYTDAANELDFYIRENDTDPVYYLDLPKSQAMQHRADNTPFKVNSRNPEREFVLPLEQVQQSRRLLDGLLPGEVEAMGKRAPPPRQDNVSALAAEAKKLAASQEHYVSHLSSNLDSLASGFEQRPVGVSFARTPDERMSSPTTAEPEGRRGVVFARVAGDGLDYARPDHRAAVDRVVESAITTGGTAEDAYNALRASGVRFVNNWNGIGEAPELHALDPQAIDIRKVMEVARQYRFPRPNSEMGIMVDGDWRSAATLGHGQPEIRGKSR